MYVVLITFLYFFTLGTFGAEEEEEEAAAVVEVKEVEEAGLVLLCSLLWVLLGIASMSAFVSSSPSNASINPLWPAAAAGTTWTAAVLSLLVENPNAAPLVFLTAATGLAVLPVVVVVEAAAALVEALLLEDLVDLEDEDLLDLPKKEEPLVFLPLSFFNGADLEEEDEEDEEEGRTARMGST